MDLKIVIIVVLLALLICVATGYIKEKEKNRSIKKEILNYKDIIRQHHDVDMSSIERKIYSACMDEGIRYISNRLLSFISRL